MKLEKFLQDIAVYSGQNLEIKIGHLNETDKKVARACIDYLPHFQQEGISTLVSRISEDLQMEETEIEASIERISQVIRLPKTISQTEFEVFIKEIEALKKSNPSVKIVFSDELKKQGFETNLRGINFSIEGVTVNHQLFNGRPSEPLEATNILEGIDFSNCHFNDCHFRYVNLSKSVFSGCLIDGCDFQESILQRVEIKSCTILRSSFDHVMALHSKWQDVIFQNCDLRFMSFYHGDLVRVQFIQSDMYGSHFLGAAAKDCLVDAPECHGLLFEAVAGFRFTGSFSPPDSPAIVFSWNIEAPGITALKADKALRNQNGIPLRFHYLPDDIDVNRLEGEVLSTIEEIESEERRNNSYYSSLPKEVLNRAKKGSELGKIIGMAREIVSHSDALVFPGGADVQPLFYKQRQEERTKPDKDFRRSMLEFALLNEANNLGLPVLGICRGSQIGNIYYGGSLYQHVEGQIFKEQEYQSTASAPSSQSSSRSSSPYSDTDSSSSLPEEITYSMVQGPVVGYSVHHQAYDEVGEDLDVIYKYIDHENADIVIKKGLEKKTGAPQIFVQWHPEFKGDVTSEEARLLDSHLSSNNLEFFKVIVQAGEIKKKQKSLMQYLKSVT